MNLVIIEQSPRHDLIHLDLTGRERPPDRGVLLTLTDPGEILAAARASGPQVDWALHELSTMPCSERRCAAFAVSIARAIGGTLYVVLASGDRRVDRIAGHLLRAGARRATG